MRCKSFEGKTSAPCFMASAKAAAPKTVMPFQECPTTSFIQEPSSWLTNLSCQSNRAHAASAYPASPLIFARYTNGKTASPILPWINPHAGHLMPPKFLSLGSFICKERIPAHHFFKSDFDSKYKSSPALSPREHPNINPAADNAEISINSRLFIAAK